MVSPDGDLIKREFTLFLIRNVLYHFVKDL